MIAELALAAAVNLSGYDSVYIGHTHIDLSHWLPASAATIQPFGFLPGDSFASVSGVTGTILSREDGYVLARISFAKHIDGLTLWMPPWDGRVDWDWRSGTFYRLPTETREP